MNRKRVAIIGATGVLGGELVRLLSQHPHVEVTAVCGSSSAGQPLHEARPSLRGAGELLAALGDAYAARVAPYVESAGIAAKGIG